MLKKFCGTLKIKLLWHCIGSRFWKTYLKKLAAKRYFSVKMHSAISNNIKVARHHWCFLNYIFFIENSEYMGKCYSISIIPVINTILDVWLNLKGHIQKQTFRKRWQYYSWLLYIKTCFFLIIYDKKSF